MLVLRESSSVKELVTSSMCTKYQRLRVVLSGINWTKKRVSYNWIWSYISEGVTNITEAGCEGNLINAICVVSVPEYRIYING